MIRDRICNSCGEPYTRFRVGLTFAGIRRELRAEPNRRHVTRHTILGRMHERKTMFWHAYHGPGRCAPPSPPPF